MNQNLSPKPDHLTREIRNRIISGQLRPGSRLPTRRELQTEFQVSSATLQKAFKQLLDEGFIITRGKSGTFVAARLPHIYRYALVFREASRNVQKNILARTIFKVTDKLHSEEMLEFEIFTSVSEQENSPVYQRLHGDVENDRLAGLILVHAFDNGEITHLIDNPRIPVVSLTGTGETPGVPWIDLGGINVFYSKAANLFHEKNRNNIALLSLGGEQERMDAFHNALAINNQKTYPWWVHVIHKDTAAWTHNLTQLLFNPNQLLRPDGLIVADDHLLEPVCSALKDTGLRPGIDLDVIVHGNFPLLATSPPNIIRLGYNIEKAMQICLDTIRQRKNGNPVSPRIVIEPVFEWEL